jgi:hypothetical protein
LPLGVYDGKNEHALSVNFESDQIRELPENGLPDRNRCGVRPWPDRIECRSFLETLQDFVDSIDEPIAPARTPLLIPERRGTDFCPCFRMKVDPHDGG